MKKLLLIASCITLLYSCSKTKKPEVGIIKKGIYVTIDGVVTNFNNDSAQIFHPQNYDATYVHGKQDSLAHIQVEVFSTIGPVPLGTYTLSADNLNPTIFPEMTYEVVSTGNFYLPDPTHYPITISITASSATNVQGTFSGTLVSSSGPPKVFKNGTFNVDIN